MSVLRLAALGLVMTSLLYLGSYVFFAVERKGSGESWFVTGLKAVPLVFGVALWIKSRAIADHFTKDFDE